MIASHFISSNSGSSFWHRYIPSGTSISKSVNSQANTLFLGIHRHTLITQQLIQSHTWDTTASLQQLRLCLGCVLCICRCTTAQVQVWGRRGVGVGGLLLAWEERDDPPPQAQGRWSSLCGRCCQLGPLSQLQRTAQQRGARSSVGPVWCSPDNHPSPPLQLQRPQWRWAGPEVLPWCLPWVTLSSDERGVCHQRSLQARAPLWSALHLDKLPVLQPALRHNSGTRWRLWMFYFDLNKTIGC